VLGNRHDILLFEKWGTSSQGTVYAFSILSMDFLAKPLLYTKLGMV
jgi:hypothetical protein